MRATVLGLVLLASGCGGKPAPASATEAHDECAAWIVKARPMQEARRRAAGKTRDEAQEEKLERYCRQEPRFRTSSEFRCVMAAVDEAAVLACGPAPAAKPPRAMGARLQIDTIANNAMAYQQRTGALPVGTSGAMPPGSCCGQPQDACAVTSDWTKTPIWTALDFTIDEPSRFQYSVESDGTTFTAYAVADLDCDGTSVSWKSVITVGDGGGTMSMTNPPPNAD